MATAKDFEDGRRAGKEGRDFWENPECEMNGGVLASQAWFAGWCKGKKEREQTPPELREGRDERA